MVVEREAGECMQWGREKGGRKMGHLMWGLASIMACNCGLLLMVLRSMSGLFSIASMKGEFIICCIIWQRREV